MKIVVFTTVAAVTLLIELLIGNFGLTLPLFGCVLFYYACAFSPAYAIAGALAGGFTVDFLYQRPLPLTMLFLLGALAAGWSVKREKIDSPAEAVLPGMLIAVVSVIGGTVVVLLWGPIRFHLGTLLWQVLFFGVLGMALLPGIVRLLDALGRTMELPGFIPEQRSRLGSNPLGGRPHIVKAHEVTPRRPREEKR